MASVRGSAVSVATVQCVLGTVGAVFAVWGAVAAAVVRPAGVMSAVLILFLEQLGRRLPPLVFPRPALMRGAMAMTGVVVVVVLAGACGVTTCVLLAPG